MEAPLVKVGLFCLLKTVILPIRNVFRQLADDQKAVNKL